MKAFPVKLNTQSPSPVYSSDSSNDSDNVDDLDNVDTDLKKPERNNSSKFEIDFHSMYSRAAISLVTAIDFDYQFKEWNDIEKIFRGILSFLKIDGSEKLCVRM